MPIDGTYGRLSAHNQRFKELRRKKLERRENKIWRNRLKNTQRSESNDEQNLESMDPEKLEAIKNEIRKKAKTQLKKEFYIFTLSLLLACVLFYFLLF